MMVRSPWISVLLPLATILLLGGADAFVGVSQRTKLYSRQACHYRAKMAATKTTQLYSSSIVGAGAADTNTTTSAELSPSTSNSASDSSPTNAQKGRTAVILNRNARGVNDWVVETVQEILDNDENAVFVTTTAEEAVDAARQIMHGGKDYQLVVPVGGDGTLTTTIQSMCEAAIVNSDDNTVTTYAQALQKLPLIGYIPLGTGNGVGSVVGCSSQVVDIKNQKSSWWSRLRRNRKKQELVAVLQALKEVGTTTTSFTSIGNATGLDTSIVKLPMMEISSKDMIKQGTQVGELCFFAGVGFDSLMLNDFKEIKAWSKKTGFLTSILSSVTGYCVALVVKTLPKTLFHGKHNIHVRVSTQHPESTLWVDHRRGDFVEACDNEVLFQGETGILAAGTAPYYGGGLRLFPFARMTLDKMQLRLGRIHPATGFWNIPGIFKGSYRETSDQFGVLDFLGTDFDVQVTTEDDGFPLQHSGESVGNVQRFRLRVVEEPVRFVSFLKKR